MNKKCVILMTIKGTSPSVKPTARSRTERGEGPCLCYLQPRAPQLANTITVLSNEDHHDAAPALLLPLWLLHRATRQTHLPIPEGGTTSCSFFCPITYHQFTINVHFSINQCNYLAISLSLPDYKLHEEGTDSGLGFCFLVFLAYH